MQKFFDKYNKHLGERHALDSIVQSAKIIKKLADKDKEYDDALKELSDMIDDFFEFREE